MAVVNFEESASDSFKDALRLIGGIGDLNTAHRDVVIKVGVFHPKSLQRTSIPVLSSITESFDKVRKIFVVESDNYCGPALDRLELWRDVFTERVVPSSLSSGADTRVMQLTGQVPKLSFDLPQILFKPNVFVDTHVLRSYEKGSLLKNLFGLLPMPQKAVYHKEEVFYSLLAGLYEAIGGIDLAVLDGTQLHHQAMGEFAVPAGVLVVGRDAVAVETVGALLAGLKPEKMRIIQEFAQRGLGEADIKRIDIAGTPLESLRDRFKEMKKRLVAMAAAAPRPWSPAKAIDKLIDNGFFELPQKRTTTEVQGALEKDDKRANTRSEIAYTTLWRRVKKGKVKAQKHSSGWLFWTE